MHSLTPEFRQVSISYVSAIELKTNKQTKSKAKLLRQVGGN